MLVHGGVDSDLDRCVEISVASGPNFLLVEPGDATQHLAMDTSNGPRHFDSRGARNASLHALVVEVERVLRQVEPSTVRDELRASWGQLVGALALDRLSELRACPICEHVGMRAATRCSYCWTKLVPPPSESAAADDAVTLGND